MVNRPAAAAVDPPIAVAAEAAATGETIPEEPAALVVETEAADVATETLGVVVVVVVGEEGGTLMYR